MKIDYGVNVKIDLGCGTNKREGYIGVDIQKHVNADIVADIRKRIPLVNGSASYVLCSHVLEHLSIDDWYSVMYEIARLLTPQGMFEIRVPHPSFDEAMILDHRHVLTPYMWKQAQKDDWLAGTLIIDRIEEISNQECVEFVGTYLPDITWDQASKFLRNAFTETVILGHKP